MAGIGIVSNRNSRHNRENPRTLERLRAVLGGDGEVVATREAGELDSVARSFRDAGIEVLGLNGGDGTNHVTLTAFLHAWDNRPFPKVAFLRGGTMNTVARSCGVRRGRPEELLARIVEKRRAGEPLSTTPRHALGVDDRFGFIFGNGIFANYLRHYYEGAEPSPSKAAWVLARAVGSVIARGEMARDIFAPVRAEVEFDGRRWEQTTFQAIAAATVTEIGLGFTPFHRTLEREGAFHALGLGCSPAALVAELPAIFRGRPTRSPRIVSEIGADLVLRQARGQAYIVDGDYHVGGETVRLRAGPRLEIVLP